MRATSSLYFWRSARFTRLDDNLNVPAEPAEAAKETRRGMKAVEDRINREMDPVLAASRMDVDEIVTPGELRLYLEAAIAMAYQSTGYRRIKNPRIWSLHDLRILSD